MNVSVYVREIFMPITAPEALAKLWKLPETARLPPAREWVYFLEAQVPESIVKIGKARDLRFRVLTLQYQCPVPLKLVGAISAPAGTERVIHAKFKPQRHFGEWFWRTPELKTFIDELPKGQPLAADLVHRWTVETGVALKREPKSKGKKRPAENELTEIYMRMGVLP